MALSTFHLFQNLPCEMRMQIWKFAARPTGGGKHALHRFDVVNPEGGDRPPNNDQLLSSRSRDNGHQWVPTVPTKDNRSGYLRDAGLWTACHESRGLMIKLFGKERWGCAKCPCYSRSDPQSTWVYRESDLCPDHKDKSFSIMVPLNGKDWKLMVNPYNDIFCFTPGLCGCPVDWNVAFARFTFSADRRVCEPVKHIGVEFGPNWGFELPSSIWELFGEGSSRSFIATAIMDCALLLRDYHIWIIDRNLHASQVRLSSSRTKSRKVFYDYDREYIEIQRDEMVFTEKEEARSASQFLRELDVLESAELARMRQEIRFRSNWAPGDPPPRVEDYVSILFCTVPNEPDHFKSLR